MFGIAESNFRRNGVEMKREKRDLMEDSCLGNVIAQAVRYFKRSDY